MRAYEHRAIGDAATGGALVNIGGESADERFMLSFGDVVALSGDFFRPGGSPMSAPGHWQATRREAETSGRLFSLGRTPGEAGTRLDSRDEIICALKVTTVDEGVIDPPVLAGDGHDGRVLTDAADPRPLDRHDAVGRGRALLPEQGLRRPARSVGPCPSASPPCRLGPRRGSHAPAAPGAAGAAAPA